MPEDVPRVADPFDRREFQEDTITARDAMDSEMDQNKRAARNFRYEDMKAYLNSQH